MDYLGTLKRAFHVTWNHKALWLFGFLSALFGSGGGSMSGQGSGRGTTIAGRPGAFPGFQVTPEIVAAVVIGVILIFLIAVTLRVASNIALMRLVREIEEGRPSGVRRGFWLGFGRFWPYVGVSLLVGVPVILLVIGLVLIGLSPLILLALRSPVAGVLGVVLAVVLMIPIVLVLVIFATVIGLLMEFILRACAVEQLGVSASIRRGWSLVTGHLKDMIITGVLLFGLGLAWGLLMIPVVLAVLALAFGFVAGAWALSQSVAVAVVVGIVLGVPAIAFLAFLGGLFKAFTSSVWTLTYLHVAGLSAPVAGQVPDSVVAGSL